MLLYIKYDNEVLFGLHHFVVIVQMARLYQDPTLKRQIDLTLTRLVLEDVNVSLRMCTLY